MNIFKNFVLNNKTLTDKLLEEISDYDIYCELTGIEFEFGKSEISPIRSDDDTPSFSLFIPTKKTNVREEEVWWRDFRSGSGDVFSFVQRYALHNFGEVLKSRKDIIEFIDSRLGLGITLKSGTKKNINKRLVDLNEARESKEILFKSREFTTVDKLWWYNIGVDIPLLNKYDVRSVKYLLSYDYTIRRTFSTYEKAYAFIIYDKVKLYQPTSIKYKWRNSCPSEYIQGWQQLENKDTLIITKSCKDMLVFKSFMDVDVVAPQSESGSFTEAQLQFIKNQYKKVFVVYDFDETGRIGAVKLKESHGFDVRWVSTELSPGKEKPDDKDISDYFINHGLEAGFLKIKSMFPELKSFIFKDKVLYFKSLITKLNNI